MSGVDAVAVDLFPDDLSDTDGDVTDGGPADMTVVKPADLYVENHVALKIPPVAVPVMPDGGLPSVDYYEMHVKEASVAVLPGVKTKIWGFEGIWPGPTIAATLGRPVSLKIYNDLPVAENLSIHNHGHNVPSKYDGHPSQNTIAQGANYTYVYPNTQEGVVSPLTDLQGASTYFFHDHMAGLTAAHVYKGIAAFYLIRPATPSAEASLNLPSGAFDVPLMIQDRTFNADNSLKYSVNVINGSTGNLLLVNGTPHPRLDVSRRKYRFRLLNGSGARRYSMSLSSGSMTMIASDGGLLKAPLVLSGKLVLAPAERADVVIDFATYPIGTIVTLINDDPFIPLLPEIIQFRVTKDEADTSALPAALNSTFVAYTQDTPTTTRSRTVAFDYDSTGGQWTINGKTYDPSLYEFNDTKLGDVEIWSITNQNSQAIPHPFHQHLVQFQIIDVCPVASPACGVAPPAYLTGWKDTVLVQPNTTVRVKMRFYYTGPDVASTVFPGDYVFHCHMLDHEDTVMMLQQKILAP